MLCEYGPVQFTFILDDRESVSPGITPLAHSKANTLVGTCRNGSYITKIVNVSLGDHPRKTTGSDGLNTILFVDITYIGETIPPMSIVHEMEIVATINGSNELIVARGHIQGNITTEDTSLFTKGMIIPTVVEYVGYNQTTHNIISISGYVIAPPYFTPVRYRVAAPTKKEIKTVMDEVNKLETEIKSKVKRRGPIFKAMLYPHEAPTATKMITIKTLLGNPPTTPTSFELNDYCQVSDMEVIKVKKSRIARKVSFLEFATEIINVARERWIVIRELSKTYATDDMFNTHLPLWTYYENLKKMGPQPEPTEEKAAEGGTINESID